MVLIYTNYNFFRHYNKLLCNKIT